MQTLQPRTRRPNGPNVRHRRLIIKQHDPQKVQQGNFPATSTFYQNKILQKPKDPCQD